VCLAVISTFMCLGSRGCAESRRAVTLLTEGSATEDIDGAGSFGLAESLLPVSMYGSRVELEVLLALSN
jgi:hypothetical protein